MYLNIVAFCISWSGAVKIKRLGGSRVPGYLSSSGINDHHLYDRRGYRYIFRDHRSKHVHYENTTLIFVVALNLYVMKIPTLPFIVALTFLTISETTSCSRRFFSPEELSTNSLPDISISISKTCYSPKCSYLGWLWRHNEDRRNDTKDVVSRG